MSDRDLLQAAWDVVIQEGRYMGRDDPVLAVVPTAALRQLRLVLERYPRPWYSADPLTVEPDPPADFGLLEVPPVRRRWWWRRGG